MYFDIRSLVCLEYKPRMLQNLNNENYIKPLVIGSLVICCIYHFQALSYPLSFIFLHLMLTGRVVKTRVCDANTFFSV